MKLSPVNGYVLIEKIPEEEKTSGILLPQESKPRNSVEIVRILKGFDHISLYDDKESLAIVEAHMIEEVKYNGELFYLIPKSGIKGLLQ